jgi:hypothetical protein
MQHLIRPKFHNLVWDARDLETAAEFWLNLYEEADRKARFRATAYHEVEIRLRGFPRQRIAAIEAELRGRFPPSDFPTPFVSRLDPDTVAIATGLSEWEERPTIGAALRALQGEPFHEGWTLFISADNEHVSRH